MASVKIKNILASLNIQEKDDSFLVTYKSKSFVTVRKAALLSLIFDAGSKELKEMFADQITTEGELRKVKDSPHTIKALKIARYYTDTKYKFYSGGVKKEFTKKSREFPDFIKCAQLLDDLGARIKDFFDAQVDGLGFANGGKGTFPAPKSLHGTNAENRYLNYMRKFQADEVETLPSNFKLFITQKDMDTELMENPRFVGAYNKIKEGKASYNEAKFAYDLMIKRRGNASNIVKDYYLKLKSDKK